MKNSGASGGNGHVLGKAGARNRREFTRVPVRLVVSLETPGGTTWTGWVRELSMNGVYALGANPPAAGMRCQVLIELQNNGEPLAVRALGRVIRSEAVPGAALRFEEIIGEDSLEHLRRLVLFNTLDVVNVEAEMAAHLGLKRRNA